MLAVVTGQPARSAICRAMLKPVAPSGLAQPMITSSTEPGSTPPRCMAAWTTWPPRVAPWVRLNEPRQDLASGVRAVETMTASTTARSLLRGLRLCLQRCIVEAAPRNGQLHDESRRLPGLRIGMRIGGEFTHATQHLAEPDAVG